MSTNKEGTITADDYEVDFDDEDDEEYKNQIRLAINNSLSERIESFSGERKTNTLLPPQTSSNSSQTSTTDSSTSSSTSSLSNSQKQENISHPSTLTSKNEEKLTEKENKTNKKIEKKEEEDGNSTDDNNDINEAEFLRATSGSFQEVSDSFYLGDDNEDIDFGGGSDDGGDFHSNNYNNFSDEDGLLLF